MKKLTFILLSFVLSTFVTLLSSLSISFASTDKLECLCTDTIPNGGNNCIDPDPNPNPSSNPDEGMGGCPSESKTLPVCGPIGEPGISDSPADPVFDDPAPCSSSCGFSCGDVGYASGWETI